MRGPGEISATQDEERQGDAGDDQGTGREAVNFQDIDGRISNVATTSGIAGMTGGKNRAVASESATLCAPAKVARPPEPLAGRELLRPIARRRGARE